MAGAGRPSTTLAHNGKVVDARDKHGHDEWGGSFQSA